MKKILCAILVFSHFILIAQQYYSYSYDLGDWDRGLNIVKVGNKYVINTQGLADTGYLVIQNLLSVNIDNPKDYSFKGYNVSPYHFNGNIGGQGLTGDSKGNLYLLGIKPVDSSIGDQIGTCIRIKSDGSHDWTIDFYDFTYNNMRSITCINDNLFMICKEDGVFNDFVINTMIWIDSLGKILKTKEILPTPGIKWTQQNKFYMLPDSGWYNVSEASPPNTALPRKLLNLKRLDKDGNTIWQTLDYEKGYFTQPSTGSPTLNGNFIGAKQSDSTYVNKDGILVNQPFVVGLFNKNGEKIYEEFEPYADSGHIRSGTYMFPLKNGDAMLVGAGLFWGFPLYEQRGLISRISSEGKIKWIKYIHDIDKMNNQGGAFFDGLELDNGDLAFSGMMNSNIAGESSNIWLLKTDSMGCITPGCVGDNIVISTTSLEDKLKMHKELFFKIFPNPAVSQTSLSFYNSKHRVKSIIKLIDLQGTILLEQELKPNELILTLPLENLTSGTYIVQYSSNSIILQSEKIIKN